MLGGRSAGYVLFAHSRSFAPRRAPVPRASEDALLLATLWVEPDVRESGLGRVLIHAAVKEAISRELKAVEVYGDRRFHEGECVLPCTWLLHEGFEVHREHPRYPLLRMDLKRVARWSQSAEAALESVVDRVKRRHPVPHTPTPAGFGDPVA